MLRLMIIFISLLFFNVSDGLTSTAPRGTRDDRYSLSQLKKISAKENVVYTTQGYVIMINECPPCPSNAVCQPCPPDFIILSPHKKLIVYPDQMGPQDLHVLLAVSDHFKLGRRYRVQLRLSHMPSWSDEKNNFEIIHADLIK